MKKRILISILIFVLTVVHKQAIAQMQKWQWAESAGIFDDDYGTSVATDAAGNVYVTGYFEGDSIIFGGITLYGYAQWGDIFLVKYDASGNVQWARMAGGENIDESSSVCTDASGNVYITGHFNSKSIIFGTDTLTNPNIYQEIFLAKYDASGNLLWAKSAGGTGRDYSNSISADASGNVYITGQFESDTITFGTKSFTNAGSHDIFVAKYDAAGNVLWAENAGGTGTDVGSSVGTDHLGNVYVTGNFGSKTITLGKTTLNNAAGAVAQDIFLAKYDASGNAVWAISAGGDNHDYGRSVTTDVSGNVYITGFFFSDTITFGSSTLTKAGAYDIFVVKYNASGKALWAKKAGGAGYDFANSITTDNLGNVYVAGTFENTYITFGKDTLKHTGKAGFDFFIAKYDTSGNTLLAKNAGGTNQNWGTGSVSADASGNMYLAGTFTSKTITFGKTTLYNVFRYDVFIAKLGFCYNTTSYQNITSCKSYAWNGNTYTASGIYKDTMANALGCDSFMTLNLTINTLPVVSLGLKYDTVCIRSGTYSLSGGLPLGGIYSGPGVSNRNFDPYEAGLGPHSIKYTYTDENGCTNTATDQVFVDICTGIESATAYQAFVIFPNPFAAEAVLEAGDILKNATLTVQNYLGQTVNEIKNINGKKVIIPRGNLASGIYFVHLKQNNNIIATQKILITD